MVTNNDDTLNAGTQNTAQPTENNEQSEKTAKKVSLKDAAVFAAGGIAGGAASVAANTFANTLNSEEEKPADDTEKQEDEKVQEEEPVATHHHRSARHSEPKSEPKEEPKEEPQSKPTQTSETEHEEDPSLFREHDVKIETIETEVNEDGGVHHIASGTVNGHTAMFVDDGHGNVMGYAVDENDNNEIEAEEIVHTDDQNITMGDLAEHLVEVESAPTQTTANNSVEVIAVENDVDMNGHTVNIAILSADNTTGAFIDVNQNGEVDVVALDENQDGDLSLDEMEVVTDRHIPMPTSDDVSQEYASYGEGGESELPDYSNDNDITLYDV